MSATPPAAHPDIIPMLAYEDGVAALDWLARAFGFRERARLVEEDGRLSHGELEAGDGLIMLATTPDYYLVPQLRAGFAAPPLRG